MEIQVSQVDIDEAEGIFHLLERSVHTLETVALARWRCQTVIR